MTSFFLYLGAQLKKLTFLSFKANYSCIEERASVLGFQFVVLNVNCGYKNM